MTAALEGGEWSAARPGRTLSPGKTRYPFYRRLGGPQGRSGRTENLVPTGIRSRTVQLVAQSLYRLSYRAHTDNGVGWADIGKKPTAASRCVERWKWYAILLFRFKHCRWRNDIRLSSQSKGKAVPLQAWSGPEGSRCIEYAPIL